MKKIGLISDTHGYLDEKILNHLSDRDEIWHAGDIGDLAVIDQLSKITKTRAVYGNIDNHKVRIMCPEHLFFTCEEVKVWMTHIGGYPPKYTTRVKEILANKKPQLFICGHSHILKVIPDQERKLLHINPGACGKSGFHKVRTLIKFEINADKIENLQAVELYPRR